MIHIGKAFRCPLRLLALVLGALCAAAPQAWAQNYPTRSIRMVLPFPPGGPTDITGRVIAQKLSELLGQPVVPDNRPGAAGNIGLELAAKAPPDGYTIVLTAPPIAISPSLYKKLNYDAQKELAPISLVAEIQNIVVTHNSVPVKNLKDLVALAQRNPGKLTFSSSGAGSTNHLASELLKGRYKLDMIHVPFKGSSPALVALMSGQVDWGTMAVPGAIPIINAGKVRGLAVLSEKRLPTLPNVPTAAESGVPDFVMSIWYGILAPAGTPREIITRLNTEIHKALAAPDVKQRLAASGVDPLVSTPDQFATHIRAETVRYAKIIKDAGITAQ
ncbi:MAG TPA: tripartite tricarboxylate transporter substrate binding protein [Burkholderiales bacterium]|nr:tripartite tricarboxylate transporter substrate binding protein [Burkholderiales bacterium]